jgi:hypothetical protein
MFMEGEFVDTVIGIPGSRSEIVMLQPPDGGAGPELSSFIPPGGLDQLRQLVRGPPLSRLVRSEVPRAFGGGAQILLLGVIMTSWPAASAAR